MTCGVYSIRNKLNGKQYIGSSKDIEGDRWPGHLNALRRDAHRQNDGRRTHLQSAWNKYGERAFEWKVIDECEEDRRLEVEQWWLDVFWPTGYNDVSVAGRPPSFHEQPGRIGGMKGKHHTAETRKVIGDANRQRGYGPSPNKGKMFSLEHRRKIGDGNRGKKRTPEMNLANSERGRNQKRRPCSEETKRKISEANRARWAQRKGGNDGSSTDS